jgi:hypothetical protein
MPTYTFSASQNVTYNGDICTIFRQRGTDSAQYLIRRITDGTVTDNVNESDLTLAACADVVNAMWPSFTYTGDNGAASQWVMNNVVKNMCQCDMNSTWSGNADSTTYTYTMGSTSWTKNKA